VINTVGMEILRMAPLSLTQQEIDEWKVSLAGGRHLFVSLASALMVDEELRNELGLWNQSEASARDKKKAPSRGRGRGGKARGRGGKASMPNRYSAEAIATTEIVLRTALIEVVRSAHESGDWEKVWPRLPNWQETREALVKNASQDAITELRAVKFES
jgi:hypothetical protein